MVPGVCSPPLGGCKPATAKRAPPPSPSPRRTSDYVNSFFNSKNSIESDPVPVHEFDGAQRRGGADQLAGIMSGFDDLDVSKGGDGGDDDLLDLMDAAAGN